MPQTEHTAEQSLSTGLIPTQLAKGALVLMALHTKRAMPGVVRRVALDGSWADVEWRAGVVTWASRVATDRLILVDSPPPTRDGRMSVAQLERWEAHGDVDPLA